MSWLFEGAALRDFSPDAERERKKREVDFFYRLLQETLRVRQLYRIAGLDNCRESNHLELGLYYAYFFIEGAEMDFLLYFRYDD